jgi:acetyltransferase-like isoleucine patch superfamily enzyme
MKKIIIKLLGFFSFLPVVKEVYETIGTQTPIRPRMWFIQKVLGFNKRAYWPVFHSSIVSYPERILIGVDTSPGYMPGCYIQGMGGIVIGNYTQVSSNVGIISRNHSPYDTRLHIEESFPSVKIGNYCWIGMNATILPGVILGDFVVVGAGSVVTKSFEDGYCVIAGNPAKKIKDLVPESCVPFQNRKEYCGYVEKSKMSKFRKSKLSI